MVNAQQSIFLILKKQLQQKTISELRLQDDSITRNETVTLEQIENCYSSLYTSNLTFSETAYDTFTDNVESPKLSEYVKETLEGPLAYDKCKYILESFQSTGGRRIYRRILYLLNFQE